MSQISQVSLKNSLSSVLNLGAPFLSHGEIIKFLWDGSPNISLLVLIVFSRLRSLGFIPGNLLLERENTEPLTNKFF